jgi:starch phosphorylase
MRRGKDSTASAKAALDQASQPLVDDTGRASTLYERHLLFLAGLTAAEVAGSRGWYSPHWHYEHEPETRTALDTIFSDEFSRNEPGIFEPLREALLMAGDHYMHLADLRSYLEADARLLELYGNRRGWAKRAILNVAASGKFSSDRSIAEYATEIWGTRPCPIP